MKTELITYTVEIDGDTYVVEDVPVRVDETTREPFFAPETVDRLQEILEKQMAEREDAEWQEFAYRSFAAGYGDDEPDYSEKDGTKSSVSVGLCEARLPLGHLHCVTVRRLGCQGTVVSEKQTRDSRRKDPPSPGGPPA